MRLSKVVVVEEVDLGGFDSSSFSDIFEDFFSDFGGATSRRTSNRGNDLRYDVGISLEDAYKGTRKKC